MHVHGHLMAINRRGLAEPPWTSMCIGILVWIAHTNLQASRKKRSGGNKQVAMGRRRGTPHCCPMILVIWASMGEWRTVALSFVLWCIVLCNVAFVAVIWCNFVMQLFLHIFTKNNRLFVSFGGVVKVTLVTLLRWHCHLNMLWKCHLKRLLSSQRTKKISKWSGGSITSYAPTGPLIYYS